MIDLNFLKKINDTYGHEQGNYAIKKLCHIVCDIFEHSPVFRIGGDEFVVILKGADYRNIENLLIEFNMKISEFSSDETLEPWERVSAAIGIALYDKDIDANVTNVFRRADQKMYDCKKAMKATRED
jgi:diguanylate cyclase (GGDEF)-like protein